MRVLQRESCRESPVKAVQATDRYRNSDEYVMVFYVLIDRTLGAVCIDMRRM